ncbi:vitellogenin receptor isoform X2 [Anoplolepis gracilipes]|uniref:vitellogenin receptor isoform X2 n=1 Tax=Anoplolepis gracilipes TaxID=354296 RepID=UPI003BA226DE
MMYRSHIVSLLLIYSMYFYGNSASYHSSRHCTKPDWFQCDDGECIPFTYVCDEEDDCNDGSDENNCKDFHFINHHHSCSLNEFTCENRDCILKEKFCDAVKDCKDGSDEYVGCVDKLNCEDKFRCKDKHCVRKNWVCDGVNDCPDGSDEWHCDNRTLSANDCTNTNNRYLCKNQRCIFLNAVCDEKDDCGDGSDEGASCKSNSCKTIKCSFDCKITPSGPVCTCKPGYKIQDKITCIDIDECQIYGICSQGCVNTEGSYRCTCEAGYTLQDDMKTCKVYGGEAMLMFSLRTEIRAMYLESEIYFTAVKNLSQANHFDVNGDYFYCSNVIPEGIPMIVKGIIEGKRETIVTQGLITVAGIALDWITGNIYFTDMGNKYIGVCDTNGTYCTVLLYEKSKPNSIALLPTKGIMFWCNWEPTPLIAKAGMDGKDRSSFLDENLEWPNSITIDYPNNRLYWLDLKKRIIESVRLDGTDRRAILSDVVKYPFSMAVFENKLYWSDWLDDSIQSCDKFTGKNWRIVKQIKDVTVQDLVIEHSAMKPKIPNPCHSNPCSELCMLNRNNSYTCGCTLDKKLKADNHTCRETKKKEHIIIIEENIFIDYTPAFLGNPKMTVSSTSRSITAATCDSLTGTILASDKSTNYIIRYNPKNGNIENLIPFEIEILGGMAFDYIGNNLYLSNKEDKSIEVHSLTTKAKTVFYFEDQPSDIAVVSEEGIMYVVFVSHQEAFSFNHSIYHLDKMKMNGIGSIQVSSTYGRGIKSLNYYKDKKTLFSIDVYGYIVSYQNESSRILRTGLHNVMSLATVGNDIFWTQRFSNLLYWTNVENKVNLFDHQVIFRMPKSVEHPLVTHLQNIVSHEKQGCQKNNGNCSHVCLPSSAILFICACPPGMMLSANNRTCTLQTACSADEVKCSEHDICIKRQKWCDGVKDCPNNEDEMSDCGETGICKKGQFMCKDGTCISLKGRCNSNYECADRSDEQNCPKKQCHSDEFQCRDGTCISNSLECDGYNDCLDYSDEINNHCRERTCSPNKFMCKDTRKCIPKEWECDGERDCSDGSDELEECNVNICGDGKLKCDNGRCISSSLKCNGINDCGDETDEKHCLNENSHNCSEDEYLCLNTDICLPKQARCNGVQDCPKNDDEHHCTYCFEDEFTCENQKCIPQSWVCDKIDDCGDKSDEKDCSGNKLINVNVNTSKTCDEFKCAMGTCLPFSKVCDGIRDCSDNSDERGKCTSACAYNNVCKDVCYKTPLGGVCGCQAGYRLAADMVSCDDINECELDVCSQICRNILGSFQCSCYDGYVIRSDRVSCKAIGSPMELITVTDDDIRKISPNLLSIEVIHSLTGLSLIGFDVNALDNTIYWSNDELSSINKINIETGELSTFTNIGSPGVLAIDWITDNIYFNDNDGSNKIKVCSLKQKKCAIVFKIEGALKAKVASLLVDPQNRWLFWSQTTWRVHDKPYSEICRTDMMGNNMKIIGFRNIGVVSGMAIDHMKARLYWSDSFHKTIESSNLDGSQRNTFLNTDVHQPLGISIFENSLYWLMGSNGQIQKCKLYANKSCDIINISSNNIHKHFAILHASRHPLFENPCEKRNCDYICVLKADDATCICKDGKPITSNSTCTKEHTNSEMRISTKRINISRFRPQGGIYSITIVTLLIIVLSLCSYFYYRKNKLKPLNDLNIRFHNPSYDRRDEVAVTLSSIVPNVSPGQHEYANPINDNLLKAAMESSLKRSEQNLCQSDKEDNEMDKHNASLISFTRTK